MGFFSDIYNKITGRNVTAEEDLFSDPQKVTDLVTDIRNVATVTVPAAKTEVQKACNALKNATGFNYVEDKIGGTISFEEYNTDFDAIAEVIEELASDIEAKGELIQAYSQGSFWTRLATDITALVAESEGFFSVLEHIGDRALSLVGYYMSEETQEVIRTVVAEDHTSNLASLWYNSSFAKKYSALQEDSAITAALRVDGEAIGLFAFTWTIPIEGAGKATEAAMQNDEISYEEAIEIGNMGGRKQANAFRETGDKTPGESLLITAAAGDRFADQYRPTTPPSSTTPRLVGSAPTTQPGTTSAPTPGTTGAPSPGTGGITGPQPKTMPYTPGEEGEPETIPYTPGEGGEPETIPYTPGTTSAPTPGTTSAPTPGTTSSPTPGTTSAPTPGTTSAPTPGTTSAPTPGTTSAPTPGTTSSPSPGTTSPAQDTTSPAQDTTSPAQDTTSPAQDTTSPAQDTTSPAQDTTSPAQDTTSPAQDTTSPQPTPNEPGNDNNGGGNGEYYYRYESAGEEIPYTSIDDVIKGNKVQKASATSKPSMAESEKNTSSIIPIAAGLTAAGAAGIGAKIYLDSKDDEEKEDNSNSDSKLSEDEFVANGWTDDLNQQQVDMEPDTTGLYNQNDKQSGTFFHTSEN